MPIRSARQFGYFGAVLARKAHKPGMSPDVAQEMMGKTSAKDRSSFARQNAKGRSKERYKSARDPHVPRSD